MKSLRLEILSTVAIILILLFFGKAFNMKITFPFSKLTMNSRLYYKLNLKLNCNNMYQNIRECAEQCYFKEKSEAGCLGFTQNKTNNNCSICNPASNSDIMVSNNTDINNNHIIYILKYKNKKPVMYLPLDEDSISGTTVIGDGVTGTLIKVENTEIHTGIVNQGLHVSNLGRVFLDNTDNVCVSHLELCSNGLSIALWLNPSNLGEKFRHITHSERSINIVINNNHRIGCWASGQTKVIPYIESQSIVFVNTWIHVTVVYYPDVGLFFYLNGTLEVFRSIGEEEPYTPSCGPHDYVFGAKSNGGYEFDGTLDEIKVFYETLTRADVWREYTSYEVDLQGEETTEMAASVINTAEMDVICGEAMNVSGKEEIWRLEMENGVCNKRDALGVFIRSYDVTEGIRQYNADLRALWSQNETLTSGGCSWWYIPEVYFKREDSDNLLLC